ncbi:TIGR00730 family Rossman fold protein [Nocardia sp. NPDC006044]|uniref:LOG family protein n=1 Tax=Nocardia sp. NPDC006044 TaxID=3364306 RepID=UPI00367F4DCD
MQEIQLDGEVAPSLSPVRSIAVFTGSSIGKPPVADRVRVFGRALAQRDIAVVYGGGHVGLMGVLADSVLAANGTVVGVMPVHLINQELAHRGLTELHTVESMHERKAAMAARADAFVALPGGTGTLEEFFEAWTWGQLGLHKKPVCLLDVEGFWHHLLAMLSRMVDDGFLAPHLLDALIVAEDVESMLDQIAAWRPPADKWA